MDALADLLDRAHARGAAFGRTVLAPPWGIVFDSAAPVAVHAVLGGEAFVSVPSQAPVRLLAGDVALVRGPGRSHLAASEQPTLLPLAAALERFAPAPLEIRFPGQASAELVCGAYSFRGDLCAALLEQLPPLVHLRAGADGAPLRPLLALLAEEVARDAPGQQVVLDRFLDLVLVYTLRAYYAQPDAVVPRWYRALGDDSIGAALRAMHAHPARPWTVESLAALANLSRAAFARRFAHLVGEPPLAYLTAWRMKLAREQLRDPRTTLAQVARAVGYSNEYAFSAAFRRHTGEPPGRWRKRQQELTDSAVSSMA